MRGYPDFLATPAYAGFGYLYREEDVWHTIPAWETYDAISIAGQGTTMGGLVQFDMADESDLIVIPRLVIDGVDSRLPEIAHWDDLQCLGETDLFYRLVEYEIRDNEAEASLTIVSGTTWGLSLILRFYNATPFNVHVNTLLYYRKCERP